MRLKFVIGAVEPKLAAERARRMVERGWKAIKVKVGRDEHPAGDVERLRAVRDAIGPTVFLSVDANGGYTVDQAVWAASRFERLDVALFEQPTPRGDHGAMAQVRRRCGLPIMADERVFTPQDALAIIRAEAADVFSLYPGKHGGIRATQAIAAMAEAAGIPCTIGSNLEREVATAAMAHVTVATANICCERFPGDLIGPLYFEQPLSRTPLRRQLIERWHTDIRRNVDLESAVASTDGYSFAEIEELKNLLVMHYMESGEWNWGWSLKQFDINRNELTSRPSRHVGFGGTGGKSVRGYGRREDDIPF